MHPSRNEFVALLTQAQKRLYGFIGTMVVDRADAEDVLQETNVALWELADQFELGTDFMAWAFRVAHRRVLKHRSTAKRLRIRRAELIDLLAADGFAEEDADHLEAAEQFSLHQRALATCLGEISGRNRLLLLQYYEQGRSLADIGLSIGRNANAVAQMFFRIRTALRACMQRHLPDSASGSA